MSSIFPGCGVSPGAHFDEEQTAGRVHCLADIAKDSQALILVPIVDDVRKDVSIRPSGDVLEEIAGLNRHPITHAVSQFPQKSMSAIYKAVEKPATSPIGTNGPTGPVWRYPLIAIDRKWLAEGRSAAFDPLADICRLSDTSSEWLDGSPGLPYLPVLNGCQ